jgi:hypothetical protein
MRSLQPRSQKKETNEKNSKLVIKFKVFKKNILKKTLFWISAKNSLNKVKSLTTLNKERLHRETIASSQEISKASSSKPISNAVTNQQNWDQSKKEKV